MPPVASTPKIKRASEGNTAKRIGAAYLNPYLSRMHALQAHPHASLFYTVVFVLSLHAATAPATLREGERGSGPIHRSR